jgi:hypothetical protein
MNGFISYAHEDYGSFSEFKIHLRAIEREFGFQFWADHRIAAGYDWTTEIDTALTKADVCVMLVSPQFIASDYIYDKEIPAIKRRRSTGALVVPVILRECSWPMLAGVLQAVPTSVGRVRPVEKWRPHNDGFNRARDQLAIAIKTHFGLGAQPVFGGAQ